MLVRYALVTLLAPILAGCQTGRSPVPTKTLRNEESMIDQFSSAIWATIQARDEQRFLSLRMKREDQPMNFLHPGGPPPPVNYDTTYQGATDQALLSEFHSQFQTGIDQLQGLVGDPSQAELVQTRYRIDTNPFYMDWGMFGFDYTLVVRGRGKTAFILQGGNYLSVHGVRWVAPFEVYARDPDP